jgi:hypothetical protein
MAKIEVYLHGKLEDGREKIEGTDDSVKIRDHGLELFEEGVLHVIPWHRVKEVVRTATPIQAEVDAEAEAED